MLGKTNLTAIEKGTIVEDIADYRWNTVHVGSTIGNFKKVISAGNILAGITTDMIVYTKDGENWETKDIELDNGDYFELSDITYGDGKYVIVGWHTDNSTYIQGLVIITKDFVDYDIMLKWRPKEYEDRKIVGISAINDTFAICAIRCRNSASGKGNTVMSVGLTDLKTQCTWNIFGEDYLNFTNYIEFSKIINSINRYKLKFAKKADGTLICYIRYTESSYSHGNSVYISKDGKNFTRLTSYELESVGMNSHIEYSSDLFNLFECKDSLYYNANAAGLHYKLTKVIGAADNLVMTTDIAYGFIDAAYYKKCEIFINEHEMLIVKAGESIADKSLEDLVEITYDFSMISIKKAFDKLYIFGSNGNILVSSNEINDEESIAVRTMSATRALYDAKAYADKRYEELEERIAALEEVISI